MRALHPNVAKHGSPAGRWPARAVLCAVLGLLAPGFAVAGTAGPASAGPVPVVTSGGGHSCALMTDQTVWCWGRNTVGQLGTGTTADSLVPVWVRTLPPAINVSAGHDHTCAVNTSNQVLCWGANAFGELGNGTTSVDNPLPVFALGIAASQVSAGDQFSCAVTLAHTVDCWGDNNFGELGNGTLADSSTPVKVKNLTNVTQVAAGYFHACALESNGTIWCWGDNSNGQLGNGSVTASKVPVQVSIQNATYVAAGFDDTCAIGNSPGDLLCWGDNFSGELGTGDFTDRHLPAQVASLSSGVSQVSLGEGFTCAIAAAPGPTALCWGDAAGYGRLGNGNFTQQDPFPTQVFGLMSSPAGGTSGPQQIAAGTNHACVVMTSGLVQCWGQGFYGNLGNGSSLDRAVPTPTVGLPGPPHTASAVSAGIFTSCAVTGSLSAACWGQMVGDGSALTTTHTSAVGVKNLPAGGVSQVSAAYGGCALVRLGGLATGLRCWGDNSWGELGNNTLTDSTTPVKVKGLSQVQSVATGGTHTCALVHNGGAWCWGENNWGQLGNGTTSNSSVPVTVTGLPFKQAQIAAADDHTCALLIDGTVRCWGLNNVGQLGDGTTSNSSTPVAVAGLTGVVQIALGSAFTCAVTGAGAVECWGDNSSGELGNGSTTNSTSPVQVSGLTGGVVAIGGGGASACATLFTGQVECWGDNSSGQLGDGSIGGISTTPVAVSGFTSNGASIGTIRGATSCSLNSSQVPECWGNNHEGELGDGGTADSGTPVVVQGL
jgi:alpha-tubulin suppressor-like RCC1 family protein